MKTPALEVVDATYRYPDGTLALDGVSFRVAENEAVGLVGSSGAGKTTLMLSIVGFLPLCRGEIRVQGIPVKPRTLRRIRSRVGLIFQNPDDQLFMPTLYDDVAFGLLNRGLEGPIVEEKVRAALAERGMQGLERKFPGHLSGGQKRLAALASVLVMEPEILLLDEPSSNLDPPSRRRLIEHLASLPNARILASHDLEMVLELCTRLLLLDHGRLVAEGEPAEILGDAEMMERYHLEVPHSLLPHRDPHHPPRGRFHRAPGTRDAGKP